jgi:hypothetical protein
MRASRGAAVASVVIVTVAATACAGTPPPDGSAPASTAARPTSQLTPEDRNTGEPSTKEFDSVTTIRITIAGQTLTAELADNPTAQDLVGRLPLTLAFRDFNRVEKVAEMARPLTLEGVPPGDDPEIGDIGYYAPSRSLVFYYGDVGYWNGIVRIGRVQGRDMQLIQRQPDSFDVAIEAAS